MKEPDHKVTLTRRIEAPAERIYEAWTDRDRLARWAGDKVEADARIGGAYRFDNRDGDKIYVHTGEYLVLEPLRRVRMSFRAGPDDPAPDRKYSDEFIEVKLTPVPGGTDLAFTNGWNGEGMDDQGIEAVQAAWNNWLDLLENSLTGGTGDTKQ